MAKKITAGATLILSKESTDNPKLCAKRLADGRLSLYLNYYLGYRKTTDPETLKEKKTFIRQKKFIGLYLYETPRTTEERQGNKEVSELAKRIRYESEQELKQRETGYRVPKKTDTDFLEYYREYIANYTKKDFRTMKVSYRRFADFLTDTPKYKAYSNGIKPAQIDGDMVAAFVEYLQKRSVGEGASAIYARFKKVVKYATEHDIFMKNPCTGISVKRDANALTKDILSMDEIRKLVSTPFQGNQNIKRAFLFSLYTGLRWCDVSRLTFGNVDYSNRLLTFTQCKTEGHSAHAVVTTPLTDGTLALIGESGGQEENIFKLPSYEHSLRSVKIWIRDAGINKHISWHCARHSFAVNLVSNGTDINTVKSLMGHSSIAMTEKYLHAVDELKKRAVEIFPALEL